jgi:hypothetical protein
MREIPVGFRVPVAVLESVRRASGSVLPNGTEQPDRAEDAERVEHQIDQGGNGKDKSASCAVTACGQLCQHDPA